MQRNYYNSDKDHEPITVYYPGAYPIKTGIVVKKKKRELRPRHVIMLFAVFFIIYGFLDNHLMNSCMENGGSAETCRHILR